MRNIYIGMIFLLGLLILAGCIKKTGSEPGNGDTGAVVLEEIDDVLPNPFKGFVPTVGDENPVYDAKLQYETYAWRELEPSRGVYDWARLERDWGNIQVTGRRVGFRVAAAIPGAPGHIDIPQWLADEGIALRPYQIDGKEGLAPDWDDPRFLQAHHDFIQALGAKYDADWRVAWIDIGSYGFWGEWHVYLNDSLAASRATKQAILEDYFSAFPTKPKVIAFDDEFARNYVASHSGGLRNDCLGTEEENNWYLSSVGNLNQTVWKTAIITGEFCGGDAGALQGTTVRFDLNYQFIRQTHWSFIGPAGGDILPQNGEHRRNLDKLHKKLGYRFVLKKFDHQTSVGKDEPLAITLQVENKGVAPFYFHWPLVCYLISEDGSVALQQDLGVDIRLWLPGIHSENVSLNIPANIASGNYDVRLAIHDPRIGKPGVMFANTHRDTEGRYLVSRLTIE